MYQVKNPALRCVLIGFTYLLCAACTGGQPPSTYMPFDPVFRADIGRSGIVPVLLFPDNPVEPVFDKSAAMSTMPTQGGLVDLAVTGIFNLGINAINSSVTEDRRSAAYKAALPAIEQLSQYDLKSDIAYTLVSESKRVDWLKLTAPIAISQATIREKGTQELLPSDRLENFYLTVSFNQTIQENYVISVRYQIFSKVDHVVVFQRDATFICGGAPSQDWAGWWTADGGQRLRAAYSKGVHAVGEIVALDLGARSALDDGISVEANVSGGLTARCPDGWWK